ncbi:Spindle pole body component [Venustampulla echinocandica]|uniref:Spindle pole body component n=1 Tax=Venustampulla echinocandica TaxID=2656787 RepID=A0A370TFV1_9HELO|nr:Spindle pole body component [Venustampulla echinocandica]RDL33777.1 Spindle pole body component [Venustampulla echinocandica]
MGDNGIDPGEPFAIPDLWAPSKLRAIGVEENDLLFSQLKLDDLDGTLPLIVEPIENGNDHVFFSIPDMPFGPTQSAPITIDAPDAHPDPAEDSTNEEIEAGDIWLLSHDNPVGKPNYQSWDAFENPAFKDCHSAYISESGPATFDAALAAKEDFLHVDNAGHVVLDTKTYVSALLNLGLGRSSVLFTWNEQKQFFSPSFQEMRISGYTGNSLDHLLTTFMECGSTTRSLQAFVNKSYIQNTSPCRIALADAVSTLLATIQARLSASTSMHNSILQLQALFQPAHSILKCFQQIVTNVSATRNDESMLSTIYQEIQLLEHRTDSPRNILLVILSRVSQPWLKFLGEWLGLQRESELALSKHGRGKSFVKVENREWVDDQGLELHGPDFILDFDKVPSFITPEDARVMFEVGRSLRFLRDHHSDHPLARADVVASTNPPALEWEFSWENIVQVESKALQYENDLKRAIQRFSMPGANPLKLEPLGQTLDKEPFQLDFFGRPEDDMEAHVLASIAAFNGPFKDGTPTDDLSLELNTYLTATGILPHYDDSVSCPPMSLVPLLSFNPIISAQARLVNSTCMRLFFKSHSLREHLDLQRDFHLLGNGVFSSRLSHALFDPELESAERQRGVARSGNTMGLRLGGRDNWPPASSELRLALMGVLSESHIPKKAQHRSHAGTYLNQNSLPGDLSFAVRDMSEDEIEKCMDPDSVEALDFLRLSYKPPPPLEAVITPLILYKYDQLFKCLLRVLRMLYVVSDLFRHGTYRSSSQKPIDTIAQRFRVEAHHFITSIGGYFFDTGIEATWRIFECKLQEIEDRINNNEGDITLGQNEGLDKLRDYHERVLDKIMFTLFLRKRQQAVLKLLEEIFALVLQFSKHSRQRALGLEGEDSAGDEVREIYLKFRKKVGVFITVCRSLSEKKGYGEKKYDGRAAARGGLFDGDDLAEENTVSHLLSRLEMSNYYSRTVNI